MERTILIADDSRLDRSILKNFLRDDYIVLEAENGQEVLDILSAKYYSISAVILDIYMPEMDGFDTLKRIRENPGYLDMPIIMVSITHELEAKVKAIELGANGFLSKPFVPYLVQKSLLNLISIRENAALMNTLGRDPLTGMLSMNLFFTECDKYIKEHEPGYYVISCIDIDNFKIINTQYGMEIGDKIIKHVAECLNICTRETNGLACRFYADKFAMIYPAAYMNDEKLQNNHKLVVSPECIGHTIRVRIGRYVVSDCTLKANTMFERAAVAEQSLKGRYDVYIAEYTDSMLNSILAEQRIVNDMESALVNHEFIPFFQPQYNHATGALVGAEALVRWKKVGSYVMPNDFVPIMENNGFIYEVDQYIWEEVCKLLRKWLDEGKEPLPVSVNISRIDIYKEDFLEIICSLTKKYDLPIELLRLEVTESAFCKSPERVISIVTKLIEYGFTVEIDDFGSGYSSLNTLKDVPASIVKLDMRFFSETENTVRSGNIIESVVRMTNWLGMTVIAEGVEKLEQADFLKSVGCYYIQGYLYAKPMPVEDYESLLEDQVREIKHGDLETLSLLDSNLFWDPSSMETLIFNSYVGGACIFEQHDKEIVLLRVNNQYIRELGNIVMEGVNLEKLNPIYYLDKQNTDIFSKAFEEASDLKSEKSCEVVISGNYGKKEYIQLRIRQIANTRERRLFYCMISNMTDLRELEQKEKLTAEKMQKVLDYADNGVIVAVLHESGSEFIFANERFYEIVGYSKEIYHQLIESDIFAIVHPEDKIKLLKVISRPDNVTQNGSYEMRVIKSDHKVIWVKATTTLTNLSGIEDPIQIVTFTDITDEKETNRKLLFLNESAHDILGLQDEEKAIDELLHRLMDYAKSERVCVAKLDWKTMRVLRKFEVCQKSVEKQAFHDVPFSNEDSWVRKLQNNEMVIMDVNENIDAYPELRDLVITQEVSRMVLTPLFTEERLIGFVGLDNYEVYAKQFEFLSAIGDYIAIMLNKKNLKHIVEKESRSANYLMEDTPGGFCRMRVYPRKEPIIVYANKGFSILLNTDYKEVQKLIGTCAYEHIHPDDIPALVTSSRNNMVNGGHIRVNCRLKRADGSYIPVMVWGRFSVENPQEIYLNAYYLDINAQTQEETGRKRLLDNLPCGAALYEYDGRTITPIHINRRFWQLLDEEACNYDDVAIMDKVHPDDFEDITQEIGAAIRQNRDFACNVRIHNAKNEYKAFHLEGCIEKISETCYSVYVTYQPINSQAIDYQRMLPVALSTVMKKSSDISFVKDRELRYICCSKPAAELLNLKSTRDVVGKTNYDFFGLKVADRISEKERKVVESGEPIINAIDKIPLDNGGIIITNSSKYPIIGADGNVVGIYCVNQDISKIKERESQLELLNNTVAGGMAAFLFNEDAVATLYTSDGFYLPFGYSKEEYLLLTKETKLAMVLEEDRETILKMIQKFREEKTDGKIGGCIYRCVKKDGSICWMDVKCQLAKIDQDVFILSAVQIDITEQKEREEHLKMLEEEYRLAAQHSGRSIARYDIAAGTITITEEDSKRLTIPQKMFGVPRERIKAGDISPDTMNAYLNFFDDIAKGKMEGNVMFQKQMPNGWRWINAHSTTLFTDDGQPVSAIISYIDITDDYEKEVIFSKWQQSLENRPDRSYSLFRCTLDQDTSFDSCEGGLIKSAHRIGRTMTFDECTLEYANNHVYEEDRDKYASTLLTDYLKDGFSKGKRRFTYEYRAIDGNSDTRWIRRSVDLVERPDAAGIIVYILYEDINESKKAELDAFTMAETDVLTGLLNRKAFVKRLEKAMNNVKENHIIAFFILDLDDFKNVNDSLGHAAGDQALIDTGRIIQSALFDGDLVGRLGGDEFIFCMLNVPSIEVIRKKARRIWKLVRRKMSDTIVLSASIGIAVYPEDGKSFEELYHMADQALYSIKENGRDSYGFYQKHYQIKGD